MGKGRLMLHERLYTPTEFWEFVQQPENAGRWFELVQGEIVEVPPPTILPTLIGTAFAYFLRSHVIEHKLGYVTADGGAYVLGPGMIYVPDAAYISYERAPHVPEKYFLSAPDLAVEIVSPNDKPHEVQKKVANYLEAGTRLVWVVYPEEKAVYVWRKADEGQMLVKKVDLNGVLEGDEVLPGFQLAVRDVFPE